MRILHCIDTLGGGGAERQLVYLAEGLIALGHEVHVAHLIGGPHLVRLEASGATLHPLMRRAHLPLTAELCGLIGELRPDVVQTWLRLMNMVGGVAVRIARRPWIYSERLMRPDDGWRSTVRHWLGGHADAVVANSAYAASRWRAAEPRGSVHVVDNALALEQIEKAAPAARAALELADDAEVVLYAGRFVPQKNIELLARALIEVLARRPRAVALLCGEGEKLPWLLGELERAGLLSRCRSLGYRRDVWSIMKIADLLVSTSHIEGRPNVVLEAMACNCPLVLSDIPEHRELVPEGGALLFGPRAEEAAAAIARTLDDRAGAARRAQRAAERVGAMTIPKMARAYEGIYAGVLARR